MKRRLGAVLSLLLILALTSACAAKSAVQHNTAAPAMAEERGGFGGGTPQSLQPASRRPSV